MSQTFFSKLDSDEKSKRLSTLADTRGKVTLWVKGSKDKKVLETSDYDRTRNEIVLAANEDHYSANTDLLCTFEIRGMNFFSQVVFLKSAGGKNLVKFGRDLFKSERRSSYRLLTFPHYEVWSEFNLDETYIGGKVIDFKSRGKSTQTGLFKNFLNLVNNNSEAAESIPLRLRVQDLSTTGMGIHIGELESKYFEKDQIFKKVRLKFPDEIIEIPEVKTVYIVDYLGPDKQLKKFKVGLHFPDLQLAVDQQLGKKINELLRENDCNNDFENFIK